MTTSLGSSFDSAPKRPTPAKPASAAQSSADPGRGYQEAAVGERDSQMDEPRSVQQVADAVDSVLDRRRGESVPGAGSPAPLDDDDATDVASEGAPRRDVGASPKR